MPLQCVLHLQTYMSEEAVSEEHQQRQKITGSSRNTHDHCHHALKKSSHKNIRYK